MALNFDKTQFYDTGITVSSANLTNAATVSLWVKRSSTDVRSPFGMNRFTSSTPFDADVFTFFYVSGPWVRLNTVNTANATVNSGTWGTDWTHLAATYNGANLRLYVAGSYQAQAAATGNVLTTGSPTFWIGRRGGYANASWNWHGDVADVAIWNVVLDDSEIASLGKGFSARRVRPQNLQSASQLVRTLADIKGLSTASGTVTPSAHPRVYA